MNTAHKYSHQTLQSFLVYIGAGVTVVYFVSVILSEMDEIFPAVAYTFGLLWVLALYLSAILTAIATLVLIWQLAHRSPFYKALVALVVAALPLIEYFYSGI